MTFSEFLARDNIKKRDVFILCIYAATIPFIHSNNKIENKKDSSYQFKFEG